MSTGSKHYQYHDGLAVLSGWSDRRRNTATAVRQWIEASSAGTTVALADIGTGDGELLSLAIQPLVELQRLRYLTIVEPDHPFREQTIGRLIGCGCPPELLQAADSMDQCRAGGFSHLLAAHVLYHLMPIEVGLASMRRLLVGGGKICVVIGGEDCDAYRMRQIVREHEGATAIVTVDSVTDGLRMTGFRHVTVRRVPALLRTTSAVAVAERGAPSFTNDPSFDLFVRWMARLPEDGPMDTDVTERIRTFLAQRSSSSGIELVLEDLVITAQAAVSAS